MISCVFRKHSPDRINVLLLRVLYLKCMLLVCFVSCDPIIKGPRQQYMDEQTSSKDAHPIVPPINQGRGIAGRRHYNIESTQMRGRRQNGDAYGKQSSREDWVGERQQDQSHNIPGEFNIIRYERPSVQNERSDNPLSERKRDETSVLYSTDPMDTFLEQEHLIRLTNERKGRFKYSGHESILEENTSKRTSKPLKAHSIPLDEFTEKMNHVTTFHDILRIFYCHTSQTCSDEELERTFLIENVPNTATSPQLTMEPEPKKKVRTPHSRQDIRPEMTSGLEQGTKGSKMMNDGHICEKCSPISHSGSFRDNLLKGTKSTPSNKNKRQPTNNSKKRKRRHNKRKKNKRRRRGHHKPGNARVQVKSPLENENAATNHTNEMRTLDCSAPTREVIHIADYETLASKVYYPMCTILYRCRKSSGCCREPHKVCGPKTIENVTLYFLTFDRGLDSVNNTSKAEAFVFENHTECECQPIKATIPHICKCPWPFMQYHDPDDMSACKCGCIDGKSPKKCKKIFRGAAHIIGDDYKCLENGTCTSPDCPKKSVFNLTKGRCLNKRESAEYQSREAEKEKKIEIDNNDNPSMHNNKRDMDDYDQREYNIKSQSNNHHIEIINSHEGRHHSRSNKSDNTSNNAQQFGSAELHNGTGGKRKHDCFITNVSDSQILFNKSNHNDVSKKKGRFVVNGESVLHGETNKTDTEVLLKKPNSYVGEISPHNNVSIKHDSNYPAINGSDIFQNILNDSVVKNSQLLSNTSEPYISNMPNEIKKNISDVGYGKNYSIKVIDDSLQDGGIVNKTFKNITDREQLELKPEKHSNESEGKLNAENVNNKALVNDTNVNNKTLVNDTNNRMESNYYDQRNLKSMNKSGQSVQGIDEKENKLNSSHSNTNISVISKEEGHLQINETVSRLDKNPNLDHLSSDNEMNTTVNPLEVNTDVSNQDLYNKTDELVTSGSGASENPDPK